MKISPYLAMEGYKSALVLEPDNYDGHPPINSISLQTRVRKIDHNRWAVASAIALQNYVSKSIEWPEAIQVDVAEAIEDFFGRRRVRVSPLNLTPDRIEFGNRQALINNRSKDLNIAKGQILFTLGDSHAVLSHAVVDDIRIASNISHFHANDEIGHAISSLATSVFVASDYAFGELCIQQKIVELMGKTEFDRYANLLESVNLKLITGSTP